jgi:hypothetical protein
LTFLQATGHTPQIVPVSRPAQAGP